MRRDIFQAIADLTRRKTIHTLVQKPLNLNSVAENFRISRPAVSKHIKILYECGLVTIKQNGRERYCKLSFGSLRQISQWVEQYRIFWTAKLNALEIFLDHENTAFKKKPIKSESIKKSKIKK